MNTVLLDLIEKLEKTQALELEEWITLIEGQTPQVSEFLFAKARKIRHLHYGKGIYIRGLIEFTNHCRNNCYYCGIRKDNHNVNRYRLSKEEILDCCQAGYQLGFRTFVLQGGEDGYFTVARLTDLIASIKQNHPDCAITLSFGEQSYNDYQSYFNAGADRYLLRHETHNAAHYQSLHPAPLSAAHRQKCLSNLMQIGFQTGTGFMVGSPGQTSRHLAEDMLFIQKLQPHMVGIGPFIPHRETPFRHASPGTLALTTFMLALLRLMLPCTLLPATTALGTIHPTGREQGILAGANVVMPNLSPSNVRKDYALYDNKIYTHGEAAEGKRILERQMNAIGYHLSSSRGDSLIHNQTTL